MPALGEAESSRRIRRTWEFRLREVFTRRIPFLLELLHTSLAQSFVSPQAGQGGHKVKLLYRRNSAGVKQYNTIYSGGIEHNALYCTAIAADA